MLDHDIQNIFQKLDFMPNMHHAYNISAGHFYSVCVVYLNESPVYVSFKEEESDTSRARIEDLCLWLYHCIKTKRNDHIVKKYCK